jgi:Arc/MetJ family transcription regulator
VAIKKTALLIDDELVRQVKALLGTATTTETVTEAMREVIRVRGRARGLERLRRREGLELDDGTMQGAWRHKAEGR